MELPQKLLILGGDSRLGQALIQGASLASISIVATSRRKEAPWFLDLSNPLKAWCLPPDLSHAIFCAGITKLESCAASPRETSFINVTQTIRLADHLAEQGVKITFLSSNQVFGPDASSPSEEINPSPASEYGHQKRIVEQHLQSSGYASAIVRLTKVVSLDWPLFQDWLHQLARNKTVAAYEDLYLSPLCLDCIAPVLLEIALGNWDGIFHLSAKESVSYYDVACWMAKQLGNPVNRVLKTPAPQPNTPGSAALTCMRTQQLIGYKPSSVRDSLAQIWEQRMPRSHVN